MILFPAFLGDTQGTLGMGERKSQEPRLSYVPVGQSVVEVLPYSVHADLYPAEKEGWTSYHDHLCTVR